MDLVLNTADSLILDKVWAHIFPLLNTSSTSHVYGDWDPILLATQISSWPRDYPPRQMISLTVLTLLGVHVLYFTFSWLSYTFIFNHDMMHHPQFLPNQVRLEIITSLKAFPAMTLLTVPLFQAEVMGYSKLYDGLDTYGWTYLFVSIPMSVLILLVFSRAILTDRQVSFVH